jgi:hypothetical protein
MRLVMLTLALLAFAAPAFADCGPGHDVTASAGSKTVATTSTPDRPVPAPGSGG